MQDYDDSDRWEVDVQQTEVTTRSKTFTVGVTIVLAVAVLLVYQLYRRTRPPEIPVVEPAPPAVVAEPEVEVEVAPLNLTPEFVTLTEGAVTLSLANLASAEDFYATIQPAMVISIVPAPVVEGQPQTEQSVQGLPAPDMTGTTLTGVINNSLTVSFIDRDRTIEAVDLEGNRHVLTVPAGYWVLNWWNLTRFLGSYSATERYEVLEIEHRPQSNPALRITAPGLLNLLVRDSTGFEHNLWFVWPTTSQPPVSQGEVSGETIVNLLMNETVRPGRP